MDVNQRTAVQKVTMFMRPSEVAEADEMVERLGDANAAIARLVLALVLSEDEMRRWGASTDDAALRETLGSPELIAERVLEVVHHPVFEERAASLYLLDRAEVVGLRNAITESALGWAKLSWELLGGEVEC